MKGMEMTLLEAMYSRPDGSDGRKHASFWVADVDTAKVELHRGRA